MNEKKRNQQSIVTTIAIAIAIVTINADSAMTQQVYPQSGQSPQQQQRDENQCSSWATQQTGYQPPLSSKSGGGRVLRDAARGAGIGAVAGLLGGDIGTGAAIGGAVGGISGGIRDHDEKEQRKDFDRAFAACMEGRGYSVK